MGAKGFRRSRQHAGKAGEAAAAAGPAGAAAAAQAFGPFVCGGCGRLIELERLVHVDSERPDGVASGYVNLDHTCDCSGPGLRTTRAWASFPAFVTLFGRMPRLPYHSPFPVTPVPLDARLMGRWHWEMEQVVGVDDFLLFLDEGHRPRP